MERPFLSIIIPVYNAEATLEAAFQSISRATKSISFPIELIVIDGGSTDRSANIIAKHQHQIRCSISERDRGVYDAMNKGLDQSQGEWIYLMGADDVLADEKVLKMVFEAISNLEEDAKLIYGRIENENREHPKIPIVHESSFGANILWRNTLHQQSVFYHRSLFESFRFNVDYKVLADYDFHLTLYEKKTSSKYEDMLVAKCNAGGLSKQFTSKLYQEEIAMKKTHPSLYPFPISIFSELFVWMKFFYKKLFR
jgi:glycosyltransferase involved in cell wall biosynthesis